MTMTVHEYCLKAFGIDSHEFVQDHNEFPLIPYDESQWNPTPKELYYEIRSCWRGEMRLIDPGGFGYYVTPYL